VQHRYATYGRLISARDRVQGLNADFDSVLV
jgi:hypothetical protein